MRTWVGIGQDIPSEVPKEALTLVANNRWFPQNQFSLVRSGINKQYSTSHSTVLVELAEAHTESAE